MVKGKHAKKNPMVYWYMATISCIGILLSISTVLGLTISFGNIAEAEVRPESTPQFTQVFDKIDTETVTRSITETAVDISSELANTELAIEEEPEITEIEYSEPVYQEPTYYSYSNRYNNDFMSAGVVYDEEGTRYTWYSQNVLPGGGLTELNESGRHVNEQGYVVDGDGYIAVASSDYEQGTVINTPFGEAKVYDTGCASGTIDVYTDF